MFTAASESSTERETAVLNEIDAPFPEKVRTALSDTIPRTTLPGPASAHSSRYPPVGRFAKTTVQWGSEGRNAGQHSQGVPSRATWRERPDADICLAIPTLADWL